MKTALLIVLLVVLPARADPPQWFGQHLQHARDLGLPVPNSSEPSTPNPVKKLLPLLIGGAVAGAFLLLGHRKTQAMQDQPPRSPQLHAEHQPAWFQHHQNLKQRIDEVLASQSNSKP